MSFSYEYFLGYMLHEMHILLMFQMSDATTEGVYTDIERSTASTATTANVYSFHFIAFFNHYLQSIDSN